MDGKSIQPTNNQNYGNVDDPEITTGIARLNKLSPIDDEVAAKWGSLEQDAGRARAGSLPYGHRKLATFLSERMDFDNCDDLPSRSTTTTTRASASSSLEMTPHREGASAPSR